jgi:hypothetical protein
MLFYFFEIKLFFQEMSFHLYFIPEIFPYKTPYLEYVNFATPCIQGDFESCEDILITSYWLHVELGKIFKKFYVKRTERKIVVKAALRPRQDNLEIVKGFRSQGVHNILCETRK